MPLRALLPGIVSVIGVVACGGDTTTPPPQPVSVVVTPASSQLNNGDTVRFSATVLDDRRAVISSAKVTWSSSDPAKMSVDGRGLAKVLVEPGRGDQVNIRATYGQLFGDAVVKLNFKAPLRVWPDTNVLFAGMTRSLIARLVTSDTGYPAPDVVVTVAQSWKSSDAAVASVDSTGTVTAVGSGHIQITAALSDGRSGIAELFVVGKPNPPLRFVAVSGGQAQIRTQKQSIFGPDFASRACGLTSDGGVYCWGVAPDASGPSDRCERTIRIGGGGTEANLHFRCSEIPYRLPSPVSFTALAMRGDQGCAISTAKQVYCWGTNRVGELGIGTIDSVVHGVTAIASSDQFLSLHLPENSSEVFGSGGFSCGLRVDRTAVCWGGVYGSTPVAVTGATWLSIADVGRCGIASDSSAYCFPNGVAERVGGSAKWSTIATTLWSTSPPTCVLDVAGKSFCGTTTTFPTAASTDPPLLGLTNYSERTGSQFFGVICGLSSAGDMYCLDKSPPRLANPGGLKLKRFFAHCGIAFDDKVYCWSGTLAVTFKLVPGQE